MELQHLRTFTQVAEAGSLTRAAELLHLSQPAVSSQIKALEVMLGIPLFRRAARGMELTAAGETLLEEAREVIRKADRLVRSAEQFADGVWGPLVLGIIDSGYDLQLARMLSLMDKAHPDVDIKLRVANSGDNRRALLDEEIDAAIVEGDPNDERIGGLRIGETRLGVIGPAAWEKELTHAGWVGLSTYPWIFQSETCSYHGVIRQVAREHHLDLKPKFQVEAFGAVQELVAEGLGLSLADLNAIQPMVEEGRIFVWPDFEVEVPVWLLALESRSGDPRIRAMLEVARTAHRGILNSSRPTNGRVAARS